MYYSVVTIILHFFFLIFQLSFIQSSSLRRRSGRMLQIQVNCRPSRTLRRHQETPPPPVVGRGGSNAALMHDSPAPTEWSTSDAPHLAAALVPPVSPSSFFFFLTWTRSPSPSQFPPSRSTRHTIWFPLIYSYWWFFAVLLDSLLGTQGAPRSRSSSWPELDFVPTRAARRHSRTKFKMFFLFLFILISPSLFFF